LREAYNGARQVAYALAGAIKNMNSAQAFRFVFGEMNYCSGKCKSGLDLNGYYGRTAWPNIAFNTGAMTGRLVAHELGHALDQRIYANDGYITQDWRPLKMILAGIYSGNNFVTGGSPDNYNRYNGKYAPENGYLSDSIPNQYHSRDVSGWNNPDDDFADIFQNWAYESFADNPTGSALYNWANTNMELWVSHAGG
jgi:hypothetical protein